MKAPKTEIYFGEADGRIHEVVQAYRDRFRNAQVMLLRTAALVEFFPD